jgi:tetratricopeptide (TPR) repeat protein
MLVTLYERNGNVRDAGSIRAKAERLFPGIEQRLVKRKMDLCREGDVYVARRHYLLADNVYWQALMIDPEYPPALIGMGTVSANRGDLANAIVNFSRAIANDPGNPAAHYDLATVYRMQGRVLDAEKEMEQFRNAEAAVKQKEGVSR